MTVSGDSRPVLPAPDSSLADRYDIGARRVFLSGTQALVRLALVQKHRDRQAGVHTAGFISGYRGSPLGGLDQLLWRNEQRLRDQDILFVPGINEELGATAVWGSQIAGMNPGRRFDGVFGIWYGKGPGLDRAMDVLKHANAAGTSRHGGVLAVVGDDHGAKSSTLPHQSDHNFSAAFVPFLAPSSVAEFVEYGLLGIGMSRFAGTWVGFKVTSDTVETSATMETLSEKHAILLPDFDFPDGGLHIRAHDIWRDEDTRLQRFKGFAAQAFARANGIDRLIWDTPRPRLGIIATGKAFADTQEALEELGIDAELARAIGLRLYKVGMPWPLEPDGVRAFAEGLQEVLVIEEKREFIEHQVKWQLYNWKAGVRPVVVGKQDEHGEWLLSPDNELTPGAIARVIAARLGHFHRSDHIDAALRRFARRDEMLAKFAPPIRRAPYFCAGCPHNSSTRLPPGSRALAGIGCHIMALWMERAETFTQMGGEGVTWVGEAPFVGHRHVFANMGDGTYHHSGILAIRQAIASKSNITFKILYNDAVAMTGGQPVGGEISVQRIAGQLLAEGVVKLWVLTEDLSRYPRGLLPRGARLHDRDMLEKISGVAAQTPGTTAIIFDQTCAAEKRRRRKRGLLVDPDTRVVINPAVCEGCGDCSVQSNCIAVEPLITEFGRKRRINQFSCNKDYSCIKGLCPSFVTVEESRLRQDKNLRFDISDVPDPEIIPLQTVRNILITGIGGTGILTLTAILGMAAHLTGLAATTSDMTGLAQKGGAVWSHVRLAHSDDALKGPRIMAGNADLVLACDMVVAADKPARNLMATDRTHVIANANIAPTAAFVRDRDLNFHEKEIFEQIEGAAQSIDFIMADHYASILLGDTIMTNMLLLGHAWQKGRLPLPFSAIDDAMALHGVAVAQNRRAFALGRLIAHDPARVDRLLPPLPRQASTLAEMVAIRADDIAAWGDARAAARYRDLVASVEAGEKLIHPLDRQLAETVARSAHKLFAYKDEYEVARLMTDGRFEARLRDMFARRRHMRFHLSPPLFARSDPRTGRPRKYAVPGWLALPVFHLLVGMRGLRGTMFDPFGHSAARRRERRAAAEYIADVERLMVGLRADNHALAVEIAALPLAVRGFGPVKEAAEESVSRRRMALWKKWDAGLAGQSPWKLRQSSASAWSMSRSGEIT